MTRARQDRLIDLLVRAGGWRTANDLAARLGVTARSVRSYVAAINDRPGGADAIESGPSGYRVRADRLATLRSGAEDAGPDARRHAVGRTLAVAAADVFELAAEHFVSEATIEADLAWVRARALERGLRWERRAASVALVGTEDARRALLRVLLHADTATGFDEIAVETLLGAGTVDAVRVMRAELSRGLSAAGFYVNEFALAGGAFAVALAAWRSASGAVIEPVEPTPYADLVEPVIAGVTAGVLGAALPEDEVRALAALLRARGAIAAGLSESTDVADAAIARDLRAILDEVTARFGVPSVNASVLERLVAHVQNLRRRSSGGEWSRNPLTRTLKARYPLLFDVAVAIAAALYEHFGIPVHDDEVAYLAMHVGGQWEKQRALENRLTATLVCPGYYELHELLRAGIEQSLGSVLRVTDVITGIEPLAADLGTDLVLTTIEGERAGDEVVHISPFFTDVDAERVMTAVSRIRRVRRLAQLREDVGHYFVPTAFVRGIETLGGEEEVIRALGAALVADGAIDEGYVESAVQREHTSSTAFTETLAVPHGMGMTARRTAIAVGVAETAMPWGEARVHVVALVAFSDSDRDAFQTVFEQFIEVFSDAATVQRIVRRSPDFPAFLENVVSAIDG